MSFEKILGLILIFFEFTHHNNSVASKEEDSKRFLFVAVLSKDSLLTVSNETIHGLIKSPENSHEDPAIISDNLDSLLEDEFQRVLGAGFHFGHISILQLL